MPIALKKSPWLAISAAALALAACDDRRDARIAAPEPAPLAALDSESAALPYAEPARVEYQQPDRGYRYAERAYGLQRTFYDERPDYGFDYGGLEPLVWETSDDWALYAEPYEDDYRYYYYEPGEAYPYFVRDDDYGYAYGPTGILLAVFDSGGRYLSRDYVYRVAPLAGRYWARGHDLRDAGYRARRMAVSDQAWTRAAPLVTRSAEPWMRAASEQPRWREWRERDRDRELSRFQAETARRDNTRQHVRLERPDQRFAPLPPPQTARFDRRDQRQAERADEARFRAERLRADNGRRQAEAQAQQRARFQQEADARGRQQAQAEQQARGREMAQGRQQAEGRARQQQQQAEQQARGREMAQARQQAEGRARQQQQQAQQQARGREMAQARQQAEGQARQQQQQQAQQQARAAEQHARQAAARERGGGQPQAQAQAQAQAQPRPQQPNADRNRGGGGRGHPPGAGKDRKD